MSNKTKSYIVAGMILLAAILIAWALNVYTGRRQPVSNQQTIVGPHSPGQIPDTVITDRRGNETLIYKPIN